MIESSGRVLADALIRELQPRAARFRELAGRPANLVTVAVDDAVNSRFVQIKQESFRAAGMELSPCWLPADAVTADTLAQLHALNGDPAVDAVFLQFPLPPGVDRYRAGDILDTGKD